MEHMMPLDLHYLIGPSEPFFFYNLTVLTTTGAKQMATKTFDDN